MRLSIPRPKDWALTAFTRRLVILTLVFVVADGVTRTVQGDFNIPGNILFSHAGYDYGPSIIEGGGVQKFWWCGVGTVPGTSFNTDVIYYRSWNSANGQWSAIAKVLWPTQGRWDGFYTCDPSVIQGSFRNPENGVTYSYAMYYTATDVQAGTNNRIGVAFSNDGVNWVKYSNPIIYPQTYPTSLYGAGQAASYNGNGAAGIRLFHTDDSTVYGTRMWTRATSDGINFGAPTLLSTAGTTLNANSDFAYDYNSGYFYAAIGGGGRPGDRETYHFSFARIPASQLLSGGGTWETLGEVNTNLTGYYLNHSPGLKRDLWGNLTGWLPNVQAYFAKGTNDPNTWELTWAEWRPTPATLPFKRYYNSGLGDHWVTTGYKGSGYVLESTLGYLFQSPQPGTHPLYGVQVGSVDHMISLDPNGEGQLMLGVNGWIYDAPGAGRVALYRARAGTDHFVTTDPNGEGQVVENGGQPIGYAKTTP